MNGLPLISAMILGLSFTDGFVIEFQNHQIVRKYLYLLNLEFQYPWLFFLNKPITHCLLRMILMIFFCQIVVLIHTMSNFMAIS